jgi:MFS family permease
VSAERIEAYVWRISAVVILGAIMSILDTTIVNVALATLRRDLHTSVADIQWIVTGYMLALASAGRRGASGRSASTWSR